MSQTRSPLACSRTRSATRNVADAAATRYASGIRPRRRSGSNMAGAAARRQTRKQSSKDLAHLDRIDIAGNFGTFAVEPTGDSTGSRKNYRKEFLNFKPQVPNPTMLARIRRDLGLGSWDLGAYLVPPAAVSA